MVGRKILLSVCLALPVVFACCGQRATVTAGGEGTVFDISPEILSSRADTLVDIGSIREGEVVQFNAWLRNAGGEPLVVKDVATSCGCTSVDYERQPIAPGGMGRFSMRFDSRGMWGMQLKLIEIRTSAAKRGYQVFLRAEVTGDENF